MFLKLPMAYCFRNINFSIYIFTFLAPKGDVCKSCCSTKCTTVKLQSWKSCCIKKTTAPFPITLNRHIKTVITTQNNRKDDNFICSATAPDIIDTRNKIIEKEIRKRRIINITTTSNYICSLIISSQEKAYSWHESTFHR